MASSKRNMSEVCQNDDDCQASRRKISRANTEVSTEVGTQTDAVLLFGSKLELYDFVRMSCLLVDQVSRHTQATLSLASFGVQAGADLRSASTQTSAEKCPSFSSAAQVTGSLGSASGTESAASSGMLAVPPAPLLSAGGSTSPVDLQRAMESYVTQVMQHLPLLSAAATLPLMTSGQPPPAAATGEANFPKSDCISDFYVKDEPVVVKEEPESHNLLHQIRASLASSSERTSPTKHTSGFEFRRRRGGGRSSSRSSRIRPHVLQCIPGHRVVNLRSFNDARDTEPDEEFRVDRVLCDQLQKSCCSQGNFGWKLIVMLYHPDDLRDCNYLGNRGKRSLSPRRLHAIEHAYHDIFPEDQVAMALSEARCAINQGLRNLAHAHSTAAAAAAAGGGANSVATSLRTSDPAVDTNQNGDSGSSASSPLPEVTGFSSSGLPTMVSFNT